MEAAVPVIGVNALVEDPSGQMRPPRLGTRALGSPAKVHNAPLSQACERDFYSRLPGSPCKQRLSLLPQAT
jgi:hypothetical protein